MSNNATKPGAKPTGQEMRLYRNKRKRKLNRPEAGQLKVGIWGRIIVGARWTEPSGLKVGETVTVRREEGRLIITK